MKELYTSPEMKLVCFAPAEKLANNKTEIDFDDFLTLGEFKVSINGANISNNDLDVNAAAAMEDAMN